MQILVGTHCPREIGSCRAALAAKLGVGRPDDRKIGVGAP
jgi:hypothetical protein